MYDKLLVTIFLAYFLWSVNDNVRYDYRCAGNQETLKSQLVLVALSLFMVALSVLAGWSVITYLLPLM